MVYTRVSATGSIYKMYSVFYFVLQHWSYRLYYFSDTSDVVSYFVRFDDDNVKKSGMVVLLSH